MKININEVFNICSDVEELFDGGQRKTFKATHPNYGSVVLKTGNYESLASLERIKREIECLRSIDSTYFPKNYEFTICPNNREYLIIEEYIKSKQLSEIKNYYNSEQKIIKLLKELILGLQILWSKRIVHRDIKPDNILITAEFRPKIIDLGIARFLDLESLTKTIYVSGPCTPVYASPEQLLNKKQFIDMRTDFFCIGIILLELHLGFHPFNPLKVGNELSIPDNIVRGLYVSPSYKTTTTQFEYLINKLLKPQPFQRFRHYADITIFLNNNWSVNI